MRCTFFKSSIVAITLTLHANTSCAWEGSALLPKETGDPFTPRPRSKGEKARNRKHRNQQRSI